MRALVPSFADTKGVSFSRWIIAVYSVLIGPLALGQPVDPAGAEAVGERPGLAKRVVRVFDFEERQTNPLEVPRLWSRHHGDGGGPEAARRYPIYNSAQLDYTMARRGEGSVLLPTSGGSTALRLSAGTLPIFEEADYLVSAWVRTKDLHHARCAVWARLLDASGRRIDGSERRSDLVVSPDGWTQVLLTMPGGFTGASFMEVDLTLLQPELFAERMLGAHEIWSEDINGGAWIDDVAVIQLPRVELSTTSPWNVARAKAPPGVRLFIRDLAGETLQGSLVLQDHRGTELGRHRFVVSRGSAELDWAPPLPALGWYRVWLELRNQTDLVGTAYVDLALLPDGADARRAPALAPLDMGVIIRESTPQWPDRAARLAEALGVGTVVLPAWRSTLRSEDVPAHVAGLLSQVTALHESNRQVVLSLDRVPADLARELGIDQDNTVAALSAPAEKWSPYVTPILDKFGQSIQRWQLGRAGDERSVWVDDLPSKVEAIRDAFSLLVPGPYVSVAWPGEASPPRGVSELVWAFPRHAATEWAAEYIAAAMPASEDPTPVRLSVALPLDVDTPFGREASIRDLIKRAVEVRWAATQAKAPAPTLLLEQPWTDGASRLSPSMPTPEFAAWASLAQRLRGRDVVARLTSIPGIRCYILAPRDGEQVGAALVAWRDDASTPSVELRVFLGAGELAAFDVFGNSSPVLLGETAGDETIAGPAPAHVLTVTDDPVFVEGVDAELLVFLSSLRLEPSFLRSLELEHDAELVAVNPWRRALTGRVRVLAPGGVSTDGQRDRSWSISPRVFTLTGEPGGEIRLPISIGFSPAQEAGHHRLLLDLDLSATSTYTQVRTWAPFEVGVRTMELALTTRASGDDLIVEARLTNRGLEPLTAEINAFATGFPRKSASAGQLPPGQTAARQFLFPRGRERLIGQRVSVGVEDIDSGARLNTSVEIR